jgi:hypothetical protein
MNTISGVFLFIIFASAVFGQAKHQARGQTDLAPL